ncbi:MAG: signal recognition particle protein [Candidatus Aenigmatarchaeota archaeon]|nr:MAG: signal recognition particle protein [Candidatus Aenigmarchaeota archaeon]
MVLDTFGDSLKKIFSKVTGYSLVDKEKVEALILELQRALIQADVDIGLVAELSDRIKKAVLKRELPKGMSMKEVLVKNLYDELVWFLGEKKAVMGLKKQKILLIGLFGSGKTTTAGKLSKWFQTRGLQPGMVACDIHRPAAQDQLEQIAKRIKVPVYRDGKKAEDIAKKAVKKSKENVLIFDSAGRDALDKVLAKELKNLGKVIKPDEVFLVIPAELGQDAGKQASEFAKLVGITGIIITKMDGTAKGGAALAACRAAGASVMFIGTGEKAGDMELYDPKRFVGRLIGYGDLEGLMDKAKEVGLDEDAAKRILEGKFTMDEFREQLKSLKGMGSMSKMFDMLPGGSSAIKKKLPAGFLDDQGEKMKKWEHAINSMTPVEREDPDTINSSRVSRIAKGSGLKLEDVRSLMKSYKQIKKVLKMTKGGKSFKRGPFAKIAKQLGMGV